VSCAAPEPSPSFVTVQVAGVSSVAWCSEFIFRRTERFASRAYVSRVSIRVLSARYYEIPSLALFPSLSRSPLRLYRYASHTRIFVFFPILSLSLSLSLVRASPTVHCHDKAQRKLETSNCSQLATRCGRLHHQTSLEFFLPSLAVREHCDVAFRYRWEASFGIRIPNTIESADTKPSGPSRRINRNPRRCMRSYRFASKEVTKVRNQCH